MRVVDTHRSVEEAAANLSRLMDDFASVSMHATGAPAIGGYRVMHGARPAPRPQRAPAPSARRNRTHIRMTGTLAMLVVSSLGVAAFSGPANCPSCGQPQATAALEAPAAHSLQRFAYAQPGVADSAGRVPLGQADLAAVDARSLPEARVPRSLDTIELADAGETVETSPISTAAIEPSGYRHSQATMILHDTRGGLLPERSQELTDLAPKPIRLAAASPVEAAPASIPEIETRTLSLSALEDTQSEAEADTEAEPVAQTQAPSSHKHAAVKRKTYRAYRSVVESRESKSKRLANIPPWAEKMFAPVWQSNAFNY